MDVDPCLVLFVRLHGRSTAPVRDAIIVGPKTMKAFTHGMGDLVDQIL